MLYYFNYLLLLFTVLLEKKKFCFNKINKFQTDQEISVTAETPCQNNEGSLEISSISLSIIFLGGWIHVEKEWKFFYIHVKNLKSCAWSSFLSVMKNSRHNLFCAVILW